MSIMKSHLNRMYERGKRISRELFTLIIDCIIELGGDPLTGIIPHGVISSVSKKLKLAHITVKRKWNLFVQYGFDIPMPNLVLLKTFTHYYLKRIWIILEKSFQ